MIRLEGVFYILLRSKHYFSDCKQMLFQVSHLVGRALPWFPPSVIHSDSNRSPLSFLFSPFSPPLKLHTSYQIVPGSDRC